MRKAKKIVLWFLFLLLCLCLVIAAGTTSPEMAASSKDMLLYKLSGMSMIFIWLLGLAVELNLLGLKQFVPLAKNNKVASHVIFWILCMTVSVSLFAVLYGMTSDAFRIAQRVKQQDPPFYEGMESPTGNTMEAPQVTESEKLVEQTKPKENITVITLPIESIPPVTTFVESHQIDEEDFSFSDAVYNVNGVEITFESLSLKREFKPRGYSLELSYRLTNTNSHEATINFARLVGNGFIVDGKKTYLSTTATYSSTHKSGLKIPPNADMGPYFIDYFAQSDNGLEMSGTDYEKVSLANLYSNQNVTVEIQFNCTVGEFTEDCTVAFNLNFK